MAVREPARELALASTVSALEQPEPVEHEASLGGARQDGVDLLVAEGSWHR